MRPYMSRWNETKAAEVTFDPTQVQEVGLFEVKSVGDANTIY